MNNSFVAVVMRMALLGARGGMTQRSNPDSPVKACAQLAHDLGDGIWWTPSLTSWSADDDGVAGAACFPVESIPSAP